MNPFEHLLAKLSTYSQTDSGFQASCPAHEDSDPSLSISQGDDGRVLLFCHAGCPTSTVVEALGLEMRDLFLKQEREGLSSPNATATVQHSTGCTIAAYSKIKRLPTGFLARCGLTEIRYSGKPAVRIPYLDSNGNEISIQFRIAETGKARLRFRSGCKQELYGLWRLGEAKAKEFVVLVEGPSDSQTLWYHGFPALGLPSAGGWKEAWAKHLEGIQTIYAIIEPDQGGESVLKWLAVSKIRDRVRTVTLNGYKDPSELHLANPDQFSRSLQEALDASVPWAEQASQKANRRTKEAWRVCERLASQSDILDRFASEQEHLGVVGEQRVLKLLYLAITSRFLDRPISIGIKGPSSAGKSYLVQAVLDFFPKSSYYALSAMSERSLVYSQEPLIHRMLVLNEAVGLNSDFASYLMRSLLSEGKLRYETVIKSEKGPEVQFLEREGPTGLIVTTTKIQLDPELETRMLSVPVTDTQQQTGAILRALARPKPGNKKNYEEWHALQVWLEGAKHNAEIPFLGKLAEAIPTIAVRLRRDFTIIRNLIETNAILHQKNRERDEEGRILASVNDYVVVKELVNDLIADEIGAALSPAIRETVEAVRELSADGFPEGVPIIQIAKILKLDKGSASRRVRAAREQGYLHNKEEKRGRPARIVIGDPMPEDIEVLPRPEEIGCTVAPASEGMKSSPPSDMELGRAAGTEEHAS